MPAHLDQADLYRQHGLVEYHWQARDHNAAIAWARKLAELSPGDARARCLLEGLQRSS
jgi:hypothetical protein